MTDNKWKPCVCDDVSKGCTCGAMTKTTTRLGWHFTKTDQLANGDGRQIVAGKTLMHSGKLIPCESGLHFSVRAIDALFYAQGNLCWRVRGGGEMLPHGDPIDKWVCRERTALWMVDAEGLLRRFARSCALDVAHLWAPPKIVMRWLINGKEKDRVPARYAARYAAGDAAEYSARSAAWDAAGDAAWDAAGYAAGYSARSAAWDAAGAATWARQNRRLESWLHAAHRGRLDLKAPLEVPKP